MPSVGDDILRPYIDRIVPVPEVALKDVASCTSAVTTSAVEVGMDTLTHSTIEKAVGIDSRSLAQRVAQAALKGSYAAAKTYLTEPSCPTAGQTARTAVRFALKQQPFQLRDTDDDVNLYAKSGDVAGNAATADVYSRLPDHAPGIGMRQDPIVVNRAPPVGSGIRASALPSPTPVASVAHVDYALRARELTIYARQLLQETKNTPLGAALTYARDHNRCNYLEQTGLWLALSVHVEAIQRAQADVAEKIAIKIAHLNQDATLVRNFELRTKMYTRWVSWATRGTVGDLVTANQFTHKPTHWVFD